MKVARQVVALCLVLLLVPHLSGADEVVLRSGKHIRGTVANRAQFKEQLATFQVLSILPASEDSSSTALLRLAREDIEFVVLEDGQQRSVFDVARIATTPSVGTIVGRTAKNPAHGIVSIVVGAGALAAGALIKLGDEQVVITDGGISVNEKSYNGGNYLMMIGGGVLVTIGIVELSRLSPPADHANLPVGSSSGLRLACVHRF